MTEENDPLVAYSKGLLSPREAASRLGLRDSADLLVALGDAELPLPRPPEEELKQQAATFVQLWKTG